MSSPEFGPPLPGLTVHERGGILRSQGSDGPAVAVPSVHGLKGTRVNRRQRFLETMTFGKPDRPASGDYFYYDSTRQRWESEGLPPDTDLDDYFGMDFNPFRWRVPVNVYSLRPDFGTTVLERTDEYETVRRPGGEVTRSLRNVPPPAMPQWVQYPLRSRQDWQDYRQRLLGHVPEHYQQGLAEFAAQERTRDYPLGMWLGGTYGHMRNWWGVEGISALFYDDPSLIEEMVECLTVLSLQALETVLSSGIELDWVMFWEDMAYKTATLLSPAMYRRFCMPFYQTVMDAVRAAGVPVAMIDSDGNISELIPLWLDVGVSVMHPMEVAAGMDVAAIRRQYGRRVGFFGGIDKRVLATTPEQIRHAVEPILRHCFADGGFIPACDHGIPPDVSLANYRYYRDLVREVSAEMFACPLP